MSRVSALYLKPDNFQNLTCFTVEVWFSFHISHCLNTHKIYYEKNWMILDASCCFEACCDKSSTSHFTLNYNNDFAGWEINHSKSRQIRTYEINFYNYYPIMATLKESEEKSLFPPRFIISVDRKSECTEELSTAIKVSLCEEEKLHRTIQFKRCVSVSPSCTSNDDFEQLIIFIKNSVSQRKLKLFVSQLPCNDKIMYIRCKGEMMIESICKATFVKEDPEATCMKISLALEQAGCDNLAKAIHARFCKPK